MQSTSPVYPHSCTSPRTLSKSDFKLARTCDAKLFFRENRYPDNREGNPYLELLAEGGYMVEALAKARYADGVHLEYGGDVADDFARTVEYLRRDEVTLFEATLLVGRQQARVDILHKKGKAIRLLEVKAKAFDGAKHAQSLSEGKAGCLRGSKTPHEIRPEWQEKLEDVTFQMLLLEKILPGHTIKPYLVLVDTSKQAAIDNIPTLFELERRSGSDGANRLHSARYVGTRDQLAQIDLLTEIDVSAEAALLRHEVEEAAATFESRLDAPLSVHSKNLERGSKCLRCEFRRDDSEGGNGFVDCWGPLAAPRPHVLELYSIGTVKAPDDAPLVEWMIKEGKASLLDIPVEFLAKNDGTVGADAERQQRQIEYTRRGEIFVGPELAAKIDALRVGGRMYFIDFETSRFALPYHHGMRPYGLVAFQWSCHAVSSLGERPEHAEWLNDKDAWPNQSFAESLREAIGDSGRVLTWSGFEAATLNQIVNDLGAFGRSAQELVEWMTDVVEHRIVDLHEWACRDYYNPGMRGQSSIKVVLDALWKSDDLMRQQFETWTGFPADKSRDPYSSLPSVEINGTLQDVREGTGAMRAYQEMMFGADRHNPDVRVKWSTLLKQYCALDTLSMVLILEHWRRLVSS